MTHGRTLVSSLYRLGWVETDYLVVGAGAMGMAFTDALIDHADVHVTLVDRRHVAGGHWEDAYSFVQLHQASLFYGVASTRLGSGAVQRRGPEAGLHERARKSEIMAYYDDILRRRFIGSGHVSFLGGSEYHAEDTSHLVTSLVSGETTRVDVRRRVVDAAYLSPAIPATTPPPFGVDDDAPVIPINDLTKMAAAPKGYVIVGSGKTATDAIVWLLSHGVPPDRLIWVRPRDPWMLNRAVVQPDPVVGLGLAADTMEAAADAVSLDDVFLRLEAAGVMLRIDPQVVPTMAKTPTLGRWELDLLRTVEHVVRLGHIQRVTRHEIVLDGGSVALPRGFVVVHCAASGLQYPPLTPIWEPDRIRLQTIRAGFPCFCAALAGYVEALETTIGSATDCVHPISFPTTLPTGRRCRSAEHSQRVPTAPSRISPRGPTTAHSTRRRSNRPNGTTLPCSPPGRDLPTTPTVDSRGWPSSPMNRCPTPTEYDPERTAALPTHQRRHHRTPSGRAALYGEDTHRTAQRTPYPFYDLPMTSNVLAGAQSELRRVYRSTSVGQIYSGLVWLASAAAWTAFGTTPGVLVLLIGGFFIYPVTALGVRLLGSAGTLSPDNPLREASVTIPIVGAMGIPVAGAAALYDIDWFYPAFMVVMGAHYLPFSHLYGMRIFLPLGTAMWLAGLALGLWAPEWSLAGAWLTGVSLVAIGVWAVRRHSIEFAATR